MKRASASIVWHEVHWARPFSLADVLDLLNHIATLSPRKAVVWEVRARAGGIRYFIGTQKRYAKPLKKAFTAHGNIEFASISEPERTEITICKQLKIAKPMLSLRTDNTLAVLKTALSALASAKDGETLVLQIILGDAIAPTPAPDKATDPHATLLDAVRGKVGSASKESLTAIRDKNRQHGFYALVRLGVKAEPKARANNLLLGVLSALRLLEAAGVGITTSTADAADLHNVHIPWYLPLHLSVSELAALVLLPFGNAALAGHGALHPKLLRSPLWLRAADQVPVHTEPRTFGTSLGTGKPVHLNISPKDSLEHAVILGPTGSGKSTAMLNLIMADIRAGRGVLVIDPKADLVNDILARVPESRANDVVVIDPSDACPVGLNPFTFQSHSTDPSHISDCILAVFRQIYSDSWGVRTQDILSGALLTLAQTKNATLLMLPRLLTDEVFRRSITSKLKDKVGLLPFWAGFEAMSKAERNLVIAPIMNKLRQFTLRLALRNVLGQAWPKFNLSDLFDKKKIVLVPLNKGIIGAEAARLLGSLIVGLMWLLTLSRAELAPEQRHITSIFIDELQDYLALPTDFADALSQARGLGVGFTVAHQYRGQLSSAIRAAIDNNARNKICFGLSNSDAKDMAAMASELEAADFMSLPRYQIYANLQNNGRNTGWVSGQTLPAPATLRLPVELKAASMARYGQKTFEASDSTEYVTPASAIDLTNIGLKRTS